MANGQFDPAEAERQKIAGLTRVAADQNKLRRQLYGQASQVYLDNARMGRGTPLPIRPTFARVDQTTGEWTENVWSEIDMPAPVFNPPPTPPPLIGLTTPGQQLPETQLDRVEKKIDQLLTIFYPKVI